MKIKPGAPALLVSLALITLTGCGMNDSSGSATPSGSAEAPLVGTSTSRDAADAVEKASSELYDLIGVKGKGSESRSGVMECEGKDPATYFKVFHPWSFYPASADQLDEAMERLKSELPKHGWKVVRYEPDTSQAKNLVLTADNTEKKYGVSVVQMKKNDPPKLSLTVVSGCYRVPEGKEVDRF
ncbi:hypothetical protein ACFWAP_22260 [Streptomyces goshikiensis]|uniref:hypothetical protein n=1 Tax=Streptomyces goshikiensis TaxID=1942 RepID=UPI00365702E3